MGSNRSNSLHRICLNYMKNRSHGENIAFLEQEFKDGGNGFILDGEKISVWYTDKGISIAQGESAFGNRYLVTFEDMNKRIGELLDLGRFVPPGILE